MMCHDALLMHCDVLCDDVDVCVYTESYICTLVCMCLCLCDFGCGASTF